MTKYTVHYFNGRGRAELSRLILAASGIQFTDKRYEGEQWLAAKPTMPLGQVPVLEVDGVLLPQSSSIARYLAKETGLAGKTNLEQAQADAIVDTIADGYDQFVKIKFGPLEEAEKDVAIAKFIAEDLPKHFGNVEKLITLYGKGNNSVGDSVTWADLHIFNLYTPFFENNADLATRFPRVNSVIKNVTAHEKVAAYVKTRPVTPW